MKYSVLLILTDGIVYNSEATKALLHKCAKLPLSIIIVGMGRADFSAMQGLERAAPKNLTFIPFRSHQHDPHSLTRAALRNFPDQFVEYFLANDMYP
jgi:hypothetical protein